MFFKKIKIDVTNLPPYAHYQRPHILTLVVFRCCPGLFFSTQSSGGRSTWFVLKHVLCMRLSCIFHFYKLCSKTIKHTAVWKKSVIFLCRHFLKILSLCNYVKLRIIQTCLKRYQSVYLTAIILDICLFFGVGCKIETIPFTIVWQGTGMLHWSIHFSIQILWKDKFCLNVKLNNWDSVRYSRSNFNCYD